MSLGPLHAEGAGPLVLPGHMFVYHTLTPASWKTCGFRTVLVWNLIFRTGVFFQTGSELYDFRIVQPDLSLSVLPG